MREGKNKIRYCAFYFNVSPINLTITNICYWSIIIHDGNSNKNIRSKSEPTICENPRCKNQSPLKFTLEIRESEFVDWQKLRVQEHSNQIPAGSMPRSMDVILRHEMVESCKAGDKCVFVGSLVVIPDGHALAKTGEVPKLSSRGNARSRPSDAATSGGGGVSGLKS